ncbi:protein translocase subunit SECA2chloroplastic-like protein, partial [Aphelenchoides avenae]
MDASAQVLPKECPICHERFNTTVNTPKIVGMCGHSVCAVCVHVCVERNHATCPLCRQEAQVPTNGLPTNFALR